MSHIILSRMEDFFNNNAIWLTPLLVAVVSGIFYLIKKSGNRNKQVVKNVKDSHVNQAIGNIKANKNAKCQN